MEHILERSTALCRIHFDGFCLALKASCVVLLCWSARVVDASSVKQASICCHHCATEFHLSLCALLKEFYFPDFVQVSADEPEVTRFFLICANFEAFQIFICPFIRHTYNCIVCMHVLTCHMIKSHCKLLSNRVFHLLPTETQQGPSEERLIWDIFGHSGENYNKFSRPVRNENDSLEVKFGLSLQQIIDVVRNFVAWGTFCSDLASRVCTRDSLFPSSAVIGWWWWTWRLRTGFTHAKLVDTLPVTRVDW